MRKFRRVLPVFVIAVFIAALALFAGQGYSYNPEAEIIGKDTFTQTMVQADGTKVNFYASGDETFNYLHDEKGYILLRDEGYLVYASSENGKPVPTDVKYTDNEEKIAALDKMVYADLDLEANSDLLTYYSASSASNLYESSEASRPIVNFVIYICFAGETITLDNELYDSYLSGNDDSLRDYYQDLSYGEIIVNNVNPIRSDVIYLYQDSQPRSYYQLKQDSSSRQVRERTLLNNAVNASSAFFDLEGLNLDINNDSYIDAVNFLISGSPYSEWGGMLWPHSWDLNDISSGNPATIGGLKVRKYSFNFMQQLTVGLLSHEFAHVLGLPDLYHYDDSHVAVGNWDLMHYEGDTPQYMTTHLRYKYLNVVDESQIENIEYNGIYTLKPVTVAGERDVLAYRINSTRSDEYFMVEYRNNSVSTYDSSLPGSGLIIYRIKEGVTGNTNAEYQEINNPDELYIFRPEVVTSGSESSKSLANLNKAFLSPSNPNFFSLGASLTDKPYSSYDRGTIYFTNGANSGIIIRALSITDEEISFEIRLSGEDSVEDTYFADKLSLSNTCLVNDNDFSGVYADLNAEDAVNLNYLSNIIGYLKNGDGITTASIRLDREKFVNSYTSGLKSFAMKFIINDKGNTNVSVFYDNEWKSYDEPVSLELYAVDCDNDYLLIGEYDIDSSEVNWESIEMTNIVYKAGISASLRSTIAVRDDGTALVSSAEPTLNNLELSDVLSASAGLYHILYVTSDLKAVSVGSSNNGENNVGGWNNIIKVAAGEYVSYGLDLTGYVYAAGNNAQTGVSSWTNIIDIAAGSNHIAGLRSNGTVVALGENEKCAVNTWANVIAVACGNDYTAGLKKDGTILIAGTFSGDVSSWSGITKISAGAEHLLGITAGNTVLAAGNNALGQCEVSSYYDIIDIAAGDYHTVLLREDGKLFYAGANTNQTNNITGNLIYYNNNYIDVQEMVPSVTAKTMRTGSTYQLNVSLYPQNATYKKLSYVSGAKGIVEVSSTGLLTAKAQGEVTITVTHKGSLMSEEILIKVIAPIALDIEPMIAAGSSHSAMLEVNGMVTAMGSNSEKQLDVDMWGNIIFIAAGGNTTVGITEYNTVEIAGELSYLDLSGWTDVVFVSVTKDAVAGILSDGTAISAGDNTDNKIDIEKSSWNNLQQISTSTTHTLGLQTDGNVLAEGGNDRQQVLLTDSWQNIVKVAAGSGFSLGLREDGTVCYAGYSDEINDMSPLSDWMDIVNISASDNHIIGVDSEGNTYALGNNSYGQCMTSGFYDISLIAAGGEHSIGITYDGEVIGAGRNNDGRLSLPDINALTVIPISSANFMAASFGVRTGETERANLSISPFNAFGNQYSISYNIPADDLGIATVDNKGNITGISEGETVLTATVRKIDSTTFTSTVSIYVYDQAESIEWLTMPTKTKYSYQDKPDLSGGKIRVTLAGGRTFSTALTADMVQNYSAVTSTMGIVNVVIKPDDGTASVDYPITVVNSVRSVEFSNTEALKTIYDYGDTIDLTGGWAQITLADGTQQGAQELKGLYDNGYITYTANTDVLASTAVIIKYTDKIIENNVFYLSYEISVFDRIMGITPQLDKTLFNYGEEIFGNGYLNVEMKSNIDILEPIAVKGMFDAESDSLVTVTNYNKYLMGTQTISISYFNPDFEDTFTANAEVTVQDTVENVEITSMSLDDKAVYECGGNIAESEVALENEISAKIYFAGGEVIEVGVAEGGQIFENIYLDFSNLTAPSSFATAKIDVKVRTASGYQIKYTKTINVLGLSNVISVVFESESDFQYRYGEETDLQLKITTADNTDGYIVNIGDSRLGIDNTILIAQAVTFTVMGIEASCNIIFRDYVQSIFIPYESKDMIVGGDLELDVFSIMASGLTEQTEDWTHSAYDNTTAGAKTVTITYQGKTCSIILNLINEITNIIVLSSPKTTYQIHEEINLSDFSIRLTFAEGNNEIVSYSTNGFIVVGYDRNIIGLQEVTITYKLTGDYWTYIFEVRNKIKRIDVDMNNSKTVYTVGEDLDITLVCVYENGDKTIVTDEFTHNFDKSQIGREQIVNITYWGTYTTAIFVEIIDAPARISIRAPLKTRYQYGEMLDLTGGVLFIITQTGQEKSEALSVYKNYLTVFNSTPLTTGKQVLTISMEEYGISASFNVYVKEKSTSDMLVAGDEDTGIKIDRVNTRVVLSERTTIADFIGKVDSYAELYFKTSNGYIDVLTGQNINMSSNIKVEVRNTEGTLIEAFSVYIKGDASGDGAFDRNDIPLLAQALLYGLDSTVIYMDYNNDREYTLTDFTLWVAKAEAQEEAAL